MTERPILFSAPMVNALLSGTKTQTRRIVKPQPPSVEAVRAKAGDRYHLADIGDPGMWRVMGPVWAVRELMAGDPVDARTRAVVGPQWRCPYGAPGDRLWVKETHAIRSDVDPKIDLAKARQYLIYRADHDGDLGLDWHHYARWRPSIHMPRWASRITLEIVSVRVQRLQAITEEDARDEGISDEDTRCDGECGATPCSMLVPAYQRLWCAINGAGSWTANPWVWALTFKRVEQSS